MDKRNEKSRQAIRQALVRLSREKPYQEISIRDLCREAGVSRSTFYNNYHIFNDVIAELSADFMQRVRGKRLSRDFFDFVLENSDELKLLLESGIFGKEFSLYLKEIIAEDLREKSGETAKETERADAKDSTEELKNDLSLNVLTLYHAYGIFGVLLNLIQNIEEPRFDFVYQESVEVLMNLIKDFSID